MWQKTVSPATDLGDQGQGHEKYSASPAGKMAKTAADIF